MKIFVNDKVYVQKNDLAYLMRGAEDISIPISIINKVFGDIFIVTDENRYEFIEFSSSEEISFFRKCDWMIDYNFFDSMTEQEIIECYNQINNERNKIANSFNALSEQEREEKYVQVSTKIELLEFKMLSARDILWHRQGKLKFDLPIETDVKCLTSNNQELEKKENAIQKILKRFRKNN